LPLQVAGYRSEEKFLFEARSRPWRVRSGLRISSCRFFAEEIRDSPSYLFAGVSFKIAFQKYQPAILHSKGFKIIHFQI